MSTQSGTPSPNVNYVLADGPDEVRRLSHQYFFIKSVFDHPSLLPPVIDHTKLHRVLDAGAGTAAWALDLADQPYASSLEIHASDITLSKFPPEEVLSRAGIKVFQHDLTKPFPEEMKGTYDLVQMSALAFAFTEDAWMSALKNIYDILAPSGYLILRESDFLAYTADQPPPPDGVKHDINERMSGQTGVHAVNCIVSGLALEKGFVVGLSYRFPDLLTPASFTIAARERALVPMGALMDTMKGLRGSSLVHFKESVTTNPAMVIDQVTKLQLSTGNLEAPMGVKIITEEGRQALVDKCRRTLDEGVMVVATEWVAQKF